jgi:hypothetical protein
MRAISRVGDIKVAGIDERMVASERTGADFLVFVYEGGDVVDEGGSSWSVDSYLLSEADLPEVMVWLHDNLPRGCCWSLAVVQHPEPAATDSSLEVAWIVGGDVLNIQRRHRSPDQEKLAQEMLARRHAVLVV